MIYLESMSLAVALEEGLKFAPMGCDPSCESG